MNRRSARLGLAVVAALVATAAAALPEDRTQPIHLEASRGQLDQKTGISVYEGNVTISQGSMRLVADTATIYVKDNNFQRMDAVGGPASLRYKPAADKPEIQGTSKRVEYDVLGGKVVMTGTVRVVQGQDVFNGERLEYDLKDDVIRAKGAGENGRIQFTIQPKSQDAAPAAKKR